PIGRYTNQKIKIMKKSPHKDCNGIDIYEGDIVKGVGKHEGESEVFFANNVWQPFDYLNDYDGNNYQIANLPKEIKEIALLFFRSADKNEILFDKGWINIFIAGYRSCQS